jgi:DNA invertase Pin-like site-specific DNA recombinase
MWGTGLLADHGDYVDMVSLCDSNEMRAEHVRDRIAASLSFYTDFYAMMRRHRPDLVIVTTRDADHDHYIVAALEAGADVITEKPMATTVEKCRRIIDTERRTGRRVDVAFNYRYSPLAMRIKERDRGPCPTRTRISMALYSYARVSTLEQSLGIQRAALKAAGCDVIRAEKASGTRRDGRTELQILLDFLRPGGALVTTHIDRLAGSLRDLQNIVHELKERRVTLRATEQPIDTGTAAGKAFLDMLGVFAEFESNWRKERQAEGIAAAKACGVDKRRKSNIDATTVRKLRYREKLGPADIARRRGIGHASVDWVLGKKAA